MPRDNGGQAREPFEDFLSTALKDHFRLEDVAPHPVILPSHIRRPRRSRQIRRTSVDDRAMTRPLLVGLAAVAALAVVGIGVARSAADDRGGMIAADPDAGSAASSSAPVTPGTESSHQGGRLSLAEVARLTGYRIQAGTSVPSGSLGLTGRAALAAVPDAAYVVGPARLGLLSHSYGAGTKPQHRWQDVWVVVTRTSQAPRGHHAVGNPAAPGGSPIGPVNSATIVFVDTHSGQIVRENEVTFHG